MRPITMGKIIGNEAAVCSSLAGRVPIPLAMLRHERSAPIWLFSFVDLAFLLLIAFTQIGPRTTEDPERLAALAIPQILGPGSPQAPAAVEGAWQLRVQPVPTPLEEGTTHAPFVLVEPGTDASTSPVRNAEDLAEALALLESRAARKPILAPHRDARAEDLLVAVALLDAHFAGGRTSTVRPGPTPSVAANDTVAKNETSAASTNVAAAGAR